MNKLHILGALGLGLMLAACGADDGGGPAAPPPTQAEVPASAMSSVQAFNQFVGSLPASDTGEALLVNEDAKPPVTETGEPLPVS
jgi:hypothetical protein